MSRFITQVTAHGQLYVPHGALSGLDANIGDVIIFEQSEAGVVVMKKAII